MKKRRPILFIGNDSNRDFDFLEKLVNQLSNKKFIVVSEHTDGRFKNLENVEILKGSWNKNILDDESIKNLYSQSKLTIIPLKTHYSLRAKCCITVNVNEYSCNNYSNRWILGCREL